MKKTLTILYTVGSMITVSACSGAANGSNGAPLQVSQDQTATSQEQAVQPPTAEGVVGAPSTTEKKTVVFSTFFPNDYFNEAKRLYEAKHPNITIELKSMSTDDAHLEQNLEQFVKTTNTALLSGKGPDLIEMDQLPTDDYIAKHMLADMGRMMEGDPAFKKEQYFTNILDGLRVNNGIYGLPLGFFVYGFIGNQTLIEKSGVPINDSKWNWTEFIDTAKKLLPSGSQGQQAALAGTPDYLLLSLVKDQYSQYVDLKNAKANFTSGAFISLLQQVKALDDNKMISTDSRGFLFRQVQINSPTDYIREMRQSEFIPNKQDYKSKLYLKPNSDGAKAGGTFRTYTTIGMNEQSAVKAEAWDFVKFMLSDELQNRPEGAGFPLNKSAYQKKVQELLQKGTVMSDQPIGPMKGKEFPITQKDIDDLDKFINGASYAVQFKPSKIDEIVLEESQAYFSGQKTAEAVADLIQNRVMTVLNE